MHPDVAFWANMLDNLHARNFKPAVPGRYQWYTEELLAAMARAGY